MGENVCLFELPDEPLYVHGFEAGMIWQKIEEGQTFESHPIHTVNKDIIERMCKMFNCVYEIVEYDETWCYLTIKPTQIT